MKRELVRCDGCGVEQEMPVAGWAQLDKFGLDCTTFSEHPLPQQYCSRSCMVTHLVKCAVVAANARGQR